MPFKKGHKFYKGGEKGQWKKGRIPWNKGKQLPLEKRHKHTLEAIEKIRQSKLKLYQDKTKCPNWKGGISYLENYSLVLGHKRRAQLRGTGGSHTVEEWENLKAQHNWSCPSCNQKEPFTNQLNKKLIQDHIIPISKGGSDNIENIQPLCGHCNRVKHARIIDYKLNK